MDRMLDTFDGWCGGYCTAEINDYSRMQNGMGHGMTFDYWDGEGMGDTGDIFGGGRGYSHFFRFNNIRAE